MLTSRRKAINAACASRSRQTFILKCATAASRVTTRRCQRLRICSYSLATSRPPAGAVDVFTRVPNTRVVCMVAGATGDAFQWQDSRRNPPRCGAATGSSALWQRPRQCRLLSDLRHVLDLADVWIDMSMTRSIIGWATRGALPIRGLCEEPPHDRRAAGPQMGKPFIQCNADDRGLTGRSCCTMRNGQRQASMGTRQTECSGAARR
jgi:hypothetical protein